MLKKYFLLLSLLTLNHVVIYGASAAQGPLIADQKPLTDKEKRALLEFLNKSPFLTFTGSKKGDTFSLVPEQVSLKDQESTLSEYIKLSVEQNSPVISIFNDNGTYYSGAAIANGELPEAKKEGKYILNLRELLSPSGQSSAIATGSTQAAAAINQGPQLLELIRQADLRRQQRERARGKNKQKSIFADKLRVMPPSTQASLPSFQSIWQPSAPQYFDLLRTIENQQAQLAQLTFLMGQLTDQIQVSRLAQPQSAVQQEPSTRFEFQGPSLLTPEEINASGQKPQASTERATYKPVKQSMSPEQLKKLIQEGISDEDLIAMGVASEDILQAEQELAQEILQDLIIEEHERKEELNKLQQERDRALALELQEQEEELARTQQAQSATRQPAAESDEEDQSQQEQTGKLSNTERNRRKRAQQRAAKERKAQQEAAERAAREKAQQEAAFEKAQQEAQAKLALQEASKEGAARKLEELAFAQNLEQQTAEAPRAEDSSSRKKKKSKGSGQASADSAALQKEKDEKDRRERAFLEREAARNGKGQPVKTLKKQDPQTIMKKILGDDLYRRMNTVGKITANILDRLLKGQTNENNDFETRMVAARAIIKGPYSDLFNKSSYKSQKEEAIAQAIEMVTEGGYFEGIKAGIEYYLTQSSLTEHDKKRLEYLMRHAKEECLLPDDDQERAKRDAEIKELEAKVEEKLKPKDSTSILKSLKDQQQPKTQAEIVMDQFTHGLTDWAASVLLDPIKGYQFLTEGQNTSGLIQQLDWWRVSLGAMISTHARSSELEKRLHLMEITSVYARLLKAVTLSVAGKSLDSKTRESLGRIVTFLSNNARDLEQSDYAIKEEADIQKKTQIQEKLALINDLINESNELLKTNPGFFKDLLTTFQNDLKATEDVIYDKTKVQFTPEKIEFYSKKLNEWLEPLGYLFDIPHDKLSQQDLDVQFSQFYACIILLRKLINAAKTIPELEELLKLTTSFIELLDKGQHLRGQQDFQQVNEHVRSFKNVIETNLDLLRQPKKN